MKINSQKFYLAFAVVFFGFFVVVCYFLYSQIEDNLSATKVDEDKWYEEFSRREEIKLLDRAVKNIQKESEQIDSHFVRNSDVVPFLNTIESLAPKVGAQAETTSVDISTDKSSLLVDIKVTGGFSSIYRFVKLLENSPYQLEFSNVDIYQKDVIGSNKLPVWEAEISIKILSFIYN